jgi:hypothetical protein
MVVGVVGWMLGWLFGLFVHQMSFPNNEPFFRQTISFPKNEHFSPDNFLSPKVNLLSPKKTLCECFQQNRRQQDQNFIRGRLIHG